MFFDGWAGLARVVIVGALAYVGLVALLRVSGKRTLSQWNAFDAIVTFALGSMLATATLSRDTSLVQGALALGLFVALQLVITWLSVHSSLVRRLVKATPTLLVEDGRILHDMLQRERVTEGEVLAAVRECGLASLSRVHALVLETSGTFSVIPKSADDDRSALADVEGSRKPAGDRAAPT